MKKQISAFILILCILLSAGAPAMAVEDSDSWKIWSQSDPRWGDLSISPLGNTAYKMKAEGCLVTAITKLFIHAGQQSPDTFTPETCLNAMFKYSLLTNTGAFYSGSRMNSNGFLATYAPELYYYAGTSHGAWDRDTAYSNISSLISNNTFVIVRVYNNTTGNYHYMAVDRAEDEAIFVMDNNEIVDLYDSGKYGGISQTLCFEYKVASDEPKNDVPTEPSSEPSDPTADPEVPETDPSSQPPQENEDPSQPPVDDPAEETDPGETTPPGELEPQAPSEAFLKNFTRLKNYNNAPYSDVSRDSWYYSGVSCAYEVGLMQGVGEGKFDASGTFSVAASITVAARIHSIYHYGSDNFVQGDEWYLVYTDYALEHGIISEAPRDYNRPATRAEIAMMISAALPDTALTPINDIADGSIPDVSGDSPYAAAVYRLYRAGILNGNDERNSFCPDISIKRSEAASIAARVAITTERIVF